MILFNILILVFGIYGISVCVREILIHIHNSFPKFTNGDKRIGEIDPIKGRDIVRVDAMKGTKND